MQATEPQAQAPQVKLSKPKARKRPKKGRRRPLMQIDFMLMRILWKWKLLSFPLASQMVFSKISKLGSYRKIKRLVNEGYLIERKVGRLEIEVIQLSKKGFDCIKYDLGETRQLRFAAQSVDHDYIATAFHLGEFVYGVPKGVTLLSEQQLQTVDSSLLPSWAIKNYEHIPDGYIRFEAGEIKKTIAIEVELNYKSTIRYMKMGYYFDADREKVDTVLWLCDGIAIAQFIANQLFEAKPRNSGVHNIILLESWIELGWEAESIHGDSKGKSIREIYLSKGYQNPSQNLVNTWSTQTKQILVDCRKSPRYSRICAEPVEPKT